jgi:hypothetical protein
MIPEPSITVVVIDRQFGCLRLERNVTESEMRFEQNCFLVPLLPLSLFNDVGIDRDSKPMDPPHYRL